MAMTSRITSLLLIAALTGVAPEAQGPPQMGPGGPGGPGGLNQPERKILEQFDADKNGWLDARERKAARAFLATAPAPGGPGGRMGGMGGGRGGGRGMPGGPGGPGGAVSGPAPEGARISPADVTHATTPLYDDQTLRTIFLTFEADDWDAELTAFHNTDVNVPALMVVDGTTYRDVGISWRGASSYAMVPAGYKRSLNVSVDFVHADQSLQGYRTLNLNNANGDPSLLRGVLYEHISSQYIPTPSANLVRVVINGEYWGVFTNVAQYNKDFLRDHFKTEDGVRWKVPGSPNGRGGLEYLGDDPAAYTRIYEIKNKDNDASWKALINLTKVLNTTPADQLEAALAPILNVDGALRFLALENTLVNSDGYWTRASDYNIYLDASGRFHIIPHDINEAMQAGGGRGGGGRGGARGGGPGGGPGGGGPTLDPLVAVNDPGKPLISKLLAVPALRAKYLAYVKDIATTWLDWEKLGPVAQRYHALIAADVAKDVKKTSTTEAFTSSLDGLKAFADARRAHLVR